MRLLVSATNVGLDVHGGLGHRKNNFHPYVLICIVLLELRICISPWPEVESARGLSMKQYLKRMRVEKATVHHQFLQCVENYIKMRNDNPDRLRLKQADWRNVQTLQTESVRGRELVARFKRQELEEDR
eukprot:6465825-Amphidinium_carterae.1